MQHNKQQHGGNYFNRCGAVIRVITQDQIPEERVFNPSVSNTYCAPAEPGRRSKKKTMAICMNIDIFYFPLLLQSIFT